jgi:hypothetical protein
MVAVRSKEDKELVLSFEGTDYFFPKGKAVFISEKVEERLKEVWPLSFDFGVRPAKDEQIAKARIEKTKSFIMDIGSPQEDMRATKPGKQVNTFNPEEGLEDSGYYGPGLEEDDVEVK